MSTKSRKFVTVSLDNNQKIFYPTDQNKTLILDEGLVDFNVAFDFKHRNEEEGIDTLACYLRIIDSKGIIWEAENIFTPTILLENMVNIEEISIINYSRISESWLCAFAENTMITGVKDLLDDRIYRTIYLDNDHIYNLQFKYQVPNFTIAFFDQFKDLGIKELTCPQFLIKLSGLYDANSDEIEPFVYSIQAQKLMFINTAYKTDSGFWEDNEIPFPIIFRECF